MIGTGSFLAHVWISNLEGPSRWNSKEWLLGWGGTNDKIKCIPTLNNPSYRWRPINLQSGSIMPICNKGSRHIKVTMLRVYSSWSAGEMIKNMKIRNLAIVCRTTNTIWYIPHRPKKWLWLLQIVWKNQKG